MSRIQVSTPARPSLQYPVVVEPGGLDGLPDLLREVAPASRYAVVADAVVADLVGVPVRDLLEGAGLVADLVRFPAGEPHKTRESWGSVSDALVGRGVGRDGCIVAVGGGVTGDLAGFVAATFMRGIPYVQVPTTLLAMVDAAVGGKTGVDTPAGKNLVGSFHQPRAVLMDPRVLATLPDDQFRSGLAETVKHGAIADAAYLEWITASADALLAQEEEPLTRLITRSVEIKAEVVSGDPEEAGRRQILNFGHTLGHALEAWGGFRLPHGYAVGAGMVAAAELGEALEVTRAGTAESLRETLASLKIPARPTGSVPPARILDLARRDKKARAQRARYILLAEVGQVARPDDGGWTFAVDDERVAEVLERAWS
ncbi:MAG TPA: 3-dehydroquinate synthase [Longimicrobiales bacterium]|nr:3-dehydroquinate synthase [Longimicrobiales bacterium]